MTCLRGVFVLSALLTVGLTAPGRALDLQLPVGAELTAERPSELDSFAAPVAPFDGAGVPAVTLEGAVTRRAWRISSPGLTPLQIIVPLRAQLEAAGYDLAFECASDICGGFDFRFNTEVLPGPNMYVNISRFRYLTALRGPRGAPMQAVGVFVSVTAASAYVQIIFADTGVDVEDMLPERTVAPVDPDQGVAGDRIETHPLLTEGHVALSDLDFATGTTDLGPGPFASLQGLAEVLRARPDLRVALVGHTDTVGGLEPNVVVSRERARSVRARLISEFGIAEGRLDAEGMGYLAPIASNLTAEGRDQNRRVEAILLNVE